MTPGFDRHSSFKRIITWVMILVGVVAGFYALQRRQPISTDQLAACLNQVDSEGRFKILGIKSGFYDSHEWLEFRGIAQYLQNISSNPPANTQKRPTVTEYVVGDGPCRFVLRISPARGHSLQATAILQDGQEGNVRDFVRALRKQLPSLRIETQKLQKQD